MLTEIDDDEYDSADSISSDIDEDEDDDVFADPLNNDPKASQASAAVKKHRRENTEHSNPYSYSWLIMRTAILRIAQNQLQDFIAVAGIEMQGKKKLKNRNSFHLNHFNNLFFCPIFCRITGC